MLETSTEVLPTLTWPEEGWPSDKVDARLNDPALLPAMLLELRSLIRAWMSVTWIVFAPPLSQEMAPEA